MPKKIIPASERGLEREIESEDPLGDLEREETKTVAAAVAALTEQSGIVKVYRRTSKDPKYSFQENVPIESLTEDFLGAEYGGGTFRLAFLRGNGSIITNRVIRIDERIKGKRDSVPTTENKSETAAGEALTTLVNKLADKQDQNGTPSGFVEMMQMQLASQQSASDKMFQMLMASNASNLSMLTAGLQSRPAEQKSPLPELVGLFMPVVLEMIRKKTDGLEDIERIARIKDLFATPEAKEDMIEKIIKYGGPLAAAILGGRGEQPPQGQQLPPPGPSPQIQMFLSVILNAARNDADPTAYALMIEHQADDATYDSLIAVLEKETWFADLFGQLSEFQDHRAWIERLREILLEDDSEEQSQKLPSDTVR